MNAVEIVTLYYLRRISKPSETPAATLAGVKTDLRRSRLWLDALDDKRELESTKATLTAADSVAQAAQQSAISESDAVDRWLRTTTAGAKLLDRPYAEQLSAARLAGKA